MGRFEPGYAADLREMGGGRAASAARPFISQNRTHDEFAELLGEQAVETATSGEDHALGTDDDDVPEDTVSPFGMTAVGEDEEE